MKNLLATGFLYAGCDRNDKNHVRVTKLLPNLINSDLILPTVVLTEVTHLVQARLGQASIRELKPPIIRPNDPYRAFYTSDNYLVAYLIHLLAPENGDSCLEPAAGSGCFIDGLLASGKKLKIRAIDLSENAIIALKLTFIQV